MKLFRKRKKGTDLSSLPTFVDFNSTERGYPKSCGYYLVFVHRCERSTELYFNGDSFVDDQGIPYKVDFWADRPRRD